MEAIVNEDFITDLAESLDVPDERYEAAERSYKSVARWIERPESAFHKVGTKVYTQGSFRLGTPIRPINDEEHYDLDVVCELALSKTGQSQAMLAETFGREVMLYAQAHGMQAPTPSRRCWTLNYADSAQFHMDLLVSVPDAARQALLRKQAQMSDYLVESSVAITDSQDPNYRRYTDDWQVSNPNGYAKWFHGRMRSVREAKKKYLSLDKRAQVEDIPEFRFKLPLQSTIQLLKRHRDMHFRENPGARPTSIVLTTLAAKSYGEEATISEALFNILAQMDGFIERRSGRWWIENPSDPRENFADHWEEDSEKRENFDDWLQVAREDFRTAARQNTATSFIDALGPKFGWKLVEKAASRRSIKSHASSLSFKDAVQSAVQRILKAPHRQKASWNMTLTGNVTLSASLDQPGFRRRSLESDAPPIPKNCELSFVATTQVPKPFRVFWQVVNTGLDATAAFELRGGFIEGPVELGTLHRTEKTSYRGTHSMQCFIVKGNDCVAQSRIFVVNIR